MDLSTLIDVSNYLYLLPVAGRYIRYRPADFLAYRLLQVGTQQMEQTRQDTAAENQLRLNVITRHYVTDSSQRCCYYTRRLMPVNSYISHNMKSSQQGHFLASSTGDQHIYRNKFHSKTVSTVSWEFTVPFEHKYGYIRDKRWNAILTQ